MPSQHHLSTTSLISAQPGSEGIGGIYAFSIHLVKSDGVVDTGIPVTSDLHITLRCRMHKAGEASAAGHWVKGSVGAQVIEQPADLHDSGVTVETTAAEEDERNTPGAQRLKIPAITALPLKLLIVPDGGPEIVDYTVKVYVWPVHRSRPKVLSPAQDLELGELHKWEAK